MAVTYPTLPLKLNEIFPALLDQKDGQDGETDHGNHDGSHLPTRIFPENATDRL
jgi:hypothetical protein